ncbi:MAG: hypothetical protein AB1714_26930 [Acidobacteriota bacterium]
MHHGATWLVGISAAVLWLGFPATTLGESWARVIGTGNIDDAYGLTTAGNGDIMLAGYTTMNGDNQDDVFLIRLKQDGGPRWMKAYGASGSQTAHSIMRSASGGFYVAGNIARGNDHDILCLSLTARGRIRWQMRYGGDGQDGLNAAAATLDGGCILVGYTKSFGAGGLDAWCLKLSSSGAVQWQNAIGTTGDDVACSVSQISDGGYSVAGRQGSSLWVASLDSTGEVRWEKTYAGDVRSLSATVRQTGGGDYFVLTEGVYSVGQSPACALLRLSPAGDVVWARLFTDQTSRAVWSGTMEQTRTGAIAVCGQKRQALHGPGDGWYMKLDGTGTIQTQSAFGEFLRSAGVTADGGGVFAGGIYTAVGGYDMTVARVPASGQFEGGCDRFRASGFTAYDGTISVTSVASAETPTTIRGVATQLRSYTPEARVKDTCARR